MSTPVSLLSQTFEINQRKLLEAIAKEGISLSFSAGDTIINYGSYIKTVPLLLSGSVKVIREDEEGREMLLYYLRPGETCAMSLTCCSTYQPSQIKAIAEEDTELIAVPVALHEQWTHQFRGWKEFVAKTYANRYQELLLTIDSIAFKNMDERLMTYLRTKFQQLKTTTLNITHQEIARDLGTSREVISRLLKQMEKQGYVTLGRNKVQLQNLSKLQS